MQKAEMKAFLAEVPLFRGINSHHIELLVGLCEVRPFRKDETLIEEGQIEPPLSVIASGEVRIILPTESRFTKVKRSQETLLNQLKPGTCFGEYSMLDSMPASASVVANSDGVALTIPQAKLHNLLTIDDRLARIVFYNMLVELVGRLKRRESEIDRSLMI